MSRRLLEDSIKLDQQVIRRNGALGLALCALLLVATIYYFPFSPEDPWFFHGAMVVQVLALGAGLLLGAAAERHGLLNEGRLKPAGTPCETASETTSEAATVTSGEAAEETPGETSGEVAAEQDSKPAPTADPTAAAESAEAREPTPGGEA